MSFKLSAAALGFVVIALGAPASAEDAMSSMAPADPMATECLDKAMAETDAMKHDGMMAECQKMYPDAMAAMAPDCMKMADAESDAMKKDEMMSDCHVMAGDAMGSM